MFTCKMNLEQLKPFSSHSKLLRTQQINQLLQTKHRHRHYRVRPPDITRGSWNQDFLLFCLIILCTITNGSIISEDANLTLTTPTSTTIANISHFHHHSHHIHHNYHHHHVHHNNSSSLPPVSTPSSSTTKTTEDDEPSLPLLPLVPPPPQSSSSFDHTIHPDKNNPKGLRFEEEPTDSYIVRSKSAMLRCRTLNALNAWFTCNSGDERRIQSNQKISNYVDPQTGIRLIEIDLEITRSDVEEHTNSGYTNPFQCWCTAYGGHHQIMSRKASVSFAYLKKQFHMEPKSVTISLDDTKPVQFKCHPPFGVPTPVVFWMRNDVIILESEPEPQHSSLSSKSSHKPHYFTEKFLRNKKNLLPKKFSQTRKSKSNQTSTLSVSKQRRHMAESLDNNEEDDDDYDDEDDDDDDLEFDASKQQEKEVDNDNQEEADLLPHHFDLAAVHHPGDGKDGKNIPINYHMTDDHSLVIKHVSMDDQANYTCGVYNVAGVRFTKTATLTVFVNGEWSSWGSWSPCQLAPGLTVQGMKCGIGTQKRVRHCSNPAPVNNGQFCPGESIQVTECTILCPPIDGFWSPWTQWSTCSHECTQVRRRICNNPVPQYGGHDCFGVDFSLKNCTGGLCRKIFDPTNFIQQSPIGPSPTTTTLQQSNDQIYFIIIFVLILIILTFVIYIVLKFQLHRRRHTAKTFNHHSWLNGSGDSDHLSHGSMGTMDPEDLIGGHSTNALTPTLLLLQQQQDGRFYNKSIKGSGGQTVSNTFNHYPMEPISTSKQQQQSTTPNKQHLLDKYHLVSRLNQQQSGVDHFLLVQQQPKVPPHPLPTIPRDDDDSTSLMSGSSTNRYEEPQFRNSPQPPPPQSHSQQNHKLNSQKKKVSPTGTGGAGTNSSSGSANTAITTTANELSQNEFEPDYAEPMIMKNEFEPQHTSKCPPNTPAPPIPPPAIMPPVNSSPYHRYSSEESCSGSSSSSGSSGSVGTLCGRHEKFLKLNMEIIRYGHYSAMPNLGVALYLPPGFLLSSSGIDHHQQRPYVDDLYIRYGIDTGARYPGLCSLSSVITLNMSKQHQHHHYPSLELSRPVILCFRHCLSFNHQQMDLVSMKNLVIMWQNHDHNHQQNQLQQNHKKSSKWIELIRLEDQDQDQNCYVHLDSNYVYLITRLFGRFMFGYKHDFSQSSSSVNDPQLVNVTSTGSMGRSPSKGENSVLGVSKLVNFSMIIEQYGQTEHSIKCFVYDNLPASVLLFQNDQLPTTPNTIPTSTSNTTPQQLIKIMIGRMTNTTSTNAYDSSLKISMPPNRSSALCFELQKMTLNHSSVKGSRRMEIPLEHLCSLGPNSMLYCSFTVGASPGNILSMDDDDELVGENDEYDGDLGDLDLRSSDSVPSSPTYENNPPKLSQRKKFTKNLDYEIKVWQQKPEARKRSHHHHHHQSYLDFVILNRLNMKLCRLPLPQEDIQQYFYHEECCRLFGDSELDLRRTLIERLDRSNVHGDGGWRQWASSILAASPSSTSFDGIHRYLTYFERQPSPSIQLMELWESKTITELMIVIVKDDGKSQKKRTNNYHGSKFVDSPRRIQQTSSSSMLMNPIKMKELFFAKLLHQLQTSILPSDLVDLILGHQF